MKPSRFGVTLLEVLIALGLTALVAGLVFGGGPALSKRFVEGRHQQVARALAWKKLAELETGLVRVGKQRGAFGGEFPEYRFDLNIEPAKLAKTAIDGLYQVSMKIFRVDPRGKTGLSDGPTDRDTPLLAFETLLYDKYK